MAHASKPISTMEKSLSWAVLLVLALVGAWVGLRQSQTNPAVEAALGQGVIIAGQTSAALADITPPSLVLLSPPERFGKASLADKINGKAELYLSAGFKSLTTQRLSLVANPESWLEIFVYRMNDLRAAFGVFAQQRRPGAASLKIGDFAYQSANAVFVVHGPHYLEVIAAKPDPGLMQAAQELARAFVAQTRVDQDTITELALFPAQGMTPSSQSYLAKNAFGFAGLDKVFIARYASPTGPITAFISRRKDRAEAIAKAEALHRGLLALGGKDLAAGPGLPGAKVVDLLGGTEVIMSVGPYLAGVHQAMDRAAALALAQRIKEALSR